MYCLYRVHRKTDDTAGLTSAWMQQRRRLLDDNNHTNPRDDVINNLLNNIRKDVDSNISVILMGDFNESTDSREKTYLKLSAIGLINIMEERYESTLPKTWNRGTQAIDHVYMTVDVARSVKKAGFAPFDFMAMSDHRGIFFDVDSSLIFDEQLYQIEPAKFRKLQSSNLKRVQEYNKFMQQEWDKHKIDERLQKLSDAIKRDGMTDDHAKRLNNIDQQITEIMRFSEKNCTSITRHSRDPWSPKLKELAREIHYLLVQIRHTIRDLFPVSVVDGMDEVSRLHAKLHTKRKTYRDYIKKAAAHRKMHLEERANYHVELGKNSNAASEIKRLSNIEQQKQDSIKINCTINEVSRDSATYILIPHHCEYASTPDFNGNIYSVQNIWNRIQICGGEEIQYWIRVTDKKLLEDMLIRWQVLNYMS